MKKISVILMVLSIIFCMLFTGCGASSVNLNDYVTVTDNGYDGYGSISASIDYKKLIEDYSDKLTDDSLDTQIFGDKTPALAAAFVFSYYDPYSLVYEDSENLKNGDVVEFSWNTSEDGIEILKQVLKINISYKNFSHKVSELEALREVDPFENIDYTAVGFSGAGEISSYPKAIIEYEDGGTTSWNLKTDDSKKGKLSNGDKVTFSLADSNDDEYYAKNYGIVLTRKSADVILNSLKYYPTENPREIFENLREEDIKNAATALKGHYDYWNKAFSNCNVGEVEVEYVGAVYYYTDPINFEDYKYDKNNKIALVFHVTNGVEPGGWYNYVSPDESAYIRYEEQKDGSLAKRTTLGTKRTQFDVFPDKHGNYFAESVEFLNKSEVRTDFTYNGIRYSGNQTLEECTKAFEYHVITNKGKVDNNYTHMIATEKLQSVVKEY